MNRSVKQTGYILLPVIVVITLVAAIALLMNTESALESNTAGSELDAQQAQYVTAAGLNHALWLTQQQGCGPYGNLTNEPLANDTYSSNLTTDLGSTNAVTISVDQDSWIRSDLPTQNNGTGLKLHTRNEIAGTERPLLRYDLSPIAAQASILSATAWFYITNAHPGGPIDIHLTSADWTETDATWDSMSTNMDKAVLATIPSQPVNNVWIQVNFTSQVQAWVNGQPNFGITLNSPVDGVHGQYNSRESAKPPYLEVVVGTPPTSPAVLKAVGTLANGVTRAITRNDAVLYQHPPGVLHLQPDAADGEDAEIWAQNPNTNYASAAETWVSSATNDTTRSLLRFNLDALPAGARILGADLLLERQSGAGADQPVSAHRIMNPWSEDSVTWNERETGTNWDTAGGDFDNTAVATTLVGPANQRYAWSITPLAQGWVDGSYANNGVALVAAITGMPGERFNTSDHADPSKWPSLSITYTCECGTACVAPQGSGDIVMIGKFSGVSTDPIDLEKEATIESWGYDVNIIDDNTIGSVDFSIYDLVYISETSDSSAVGSNLTNLTIGIVNEEGDLNPQLELADGMGTKIGGSIDIVDISHYITAPFALGSLPIYSGVMEQLTVTGSLAGGLQTLADAGGVDSLVVLDQGAITKGGGTAAGRRVTLPLGRATVGNFNWSQLNSNGRLIVQRAIEWGIGNISGPPLINVLFVVPDATALGPQDAAKKALMESWNFGVALITAADSQSNYDAAVAGADVVYISEEITSSDTGTKLRAATIGVVIEETALTDEFGISDSQAGYIGTDIEVVDITHYITSVFAMGPLTIASSATDLDRLVGILAPDLNTLAQITAIPGLATLDTGGQLYDTGTATGRRVKLPWGTSNFDINLLTADGLTVMKRALEWGAGASLSVGPFNVLFVVGNVGGPGMTAEEIDHQTLIESWGHTVEIIDDGANQAAFDTAVANNDVVFTTNDITASTLGTKLVNATIGVVTSEDNLSDEFGLSSSIDWGSDDYIGITDNTHYITSPFGEVKLLILSTPESLAYLTGTLSPDLGLLAFAVAGTGVATLEAGATMYGGGSAAGRRVQLPWGGTGFDPNHLNADGLTILKRSLEWGAGVGAVNRLLFVVTDAASPMADEIERQTLVESWGYIVTRISDEDSQANFDAAAAVNDLAYISGDALYNNVDIKLADATIGVAFESYQLHNEFGMSPGSVALANLQSITIIDNTHYITSPFTGLVNVTTANTQLSSVSSYAPDTQLQLLASIPGYNGALATFNTGDLDHWGAPVAGRRVKLPWGSTDWGFDFSTLSTDGQVILKRSLEWIAGAGAGGGGGGGGPGYTELHQPWSATSADTWQTVDLSGFGVPADAVVEVAVINARTGNERWGGVRAVGSSLERRFQLHEAEGKGMDAVTMHVQADASSQIEHYSDAIADVTFILLGYWTGASYVELFEPFTANEDGIWINENLSSNGLGPNQVAEIAMVNTHASTQFLVGLRATGSTYQRRFDIHEAESGGVDGLTLWVQTDSSARVKVYAEDNEKIDFYVLGYWSSPPGTYTEAGGAQGQVSTPATWEPTDLTSFGVPADAIAQFVITNESAGSENNMGVRTTGSPLSRLLDLHEAESGGSDIATMHVNVDGSSQVEWYAESGGAERLFYPVGWWVLP